MNPPLLTDHQIDTLLTEYFGNACPLPDELPDEWLTAGSRDDTVTEPVATVTSIDVALTSAPPSKPSTTSTPFTTSAPGRRRFGPIGAAVAGLLLAVTGWGLFVGPATDPVSSTATDSQTIERTEQPEPVTPKIAAPTPALADSTGETGPEETGNPSPDSGSPVFTPTESDSDHETDPSLLELDVEVFDDGE